MKILKPINLPVTKFILKRHYQASKELSSTKGAKRILVLAPHMDDETIGPGGVIRKHANEGAEVHCVFITDGSNSVSDLSKEELTNARMDEMEKVKNILGITDIHYLGLPDGHVESNKDTQKKLAEVIKSINPDLIYCTSFVDAHPDHTATATILSDVLKQTDNHNFAIRLYEINCPIPPKYINCVVDISDTVIEKDKAVDIFASQTIAFDGFLELNRLKSNLVQDEVSAVEAFFEPSISMFIHHCDRLREDKQPFPEIFKQANRTDTLLWAIYKNFKRKQMFYEDSLKDYEYLKLRKSS